MQSIVSYQSDKEKRRAAATKESIPYTGNIPRVCETLVTDYFNFIGKTNVLLLLQSMDKQTSRIPKAPTAASRPKSSATFKPSTLTVKQASFNFAANGAKVTAKKAPKLGKA